MTEQKHINCMALHPKRKCAQASSRRYLHSVGVLHHSPLLRFRFEAFRFRVEGFITPKPKTLNPSCRPSTSSEHQHLQLLIKGSDKIETRTLRVAKKVPYGVQGF